MPLDILCDDDGDVLEDEDSVDDPGRIWNWCENACHDGAGATKRLDIAVRKLREQLLMKRKLHYCVLPSETDPKVAINIFVETNKSSLTIKMFDIVVALAQGMLWRGSPEAHH